MACSFYRAHAVLIPRFVASRTCFHPPSRAGRYSTGISYKKEEVMKMGIGLFIGVLIILLGLGIIVNVIFHIHIPIFMILFGLILIYIGLKIILGPWFSFPICHGESGNVIFHERTYRGLSGDSKEYNAVFGKAVVDLRDIELKEKVTRIKINAVFGGVKVLLSAATPVRIKADAVFGGVQLPENVTGAFGTSTYQSRNFNENQNYLLIEGASVFGGIVIRYQ
jgi:hypothetical protein